MNGVPGTLAREIGQKQIHRGLADGSVMINAEKKISSTEDVQNVLRDAYIAPLPLSQLVRKRSQRLAPRYDFIAAARLQEDGSGSQQCGSEPESQVRTHGRASSLRPTRKSWWRRKSMTSETTKMSQPENT